jgi:hypothetical protein
MRLKKTDLAVLMLVISFIIVPGAAGKGAPIKGDFPLETGKISPVYSLFFFQTTIMVPSYLTGNSDYNPGPEDNLYLQTATSEDDAGPDTEGSPGAASGMAPEIQTATTEGNAGPETGEAPGTASGTDTEIQTATTEGNAGPVVEVSSGVSSVILSKIPFWVLGFLGVDIIIAMIILYLAVKKKI